MLPKNTQDVDNFIVFGAVTTFRYTNHKGEVEMRRVVPLCLRFGSTPHYPEPQWLLECIALDRDNGAFRTFALDMIHPR
jgi:predicted DNA-binding transcriptional regulator YafY